MPWKFGKREPSKAVPEWTGFLDKSVRFEGTLECPGTFRVEGDVKGLLISTHTLILGEEARVEGQIEGNDVVISGRFNGAIFAKGKVEIHNKGIATGEIHSHCLVIEPGGIFDGECHVIAPSEAAKSVTIPIRAAQAG
ncbi:MAG: polymer-forming cytoskeletal protein [Acidobacteria bacterium]|nr:MAG: polymer-forming cytoskeletal protein [Acidobacteriota bacterium]